MSSQNSDALDTYCVCVSDGRVERVVHWDGDSLSARWPADPYEHPATVVGPWRVCLTAAHLQSWYQRSLKNSAWRAIQLGLGKLWDTVQYLLFWQAPLGVRSAIHRHHPLQRTVLSQVDCVIQYEVVGSKISLDGVQPRDTGMPWWSLPVLWDGASH